MYKTKEIDNCLKLLNSMGREQKLEMINNSNLTDKEIRIIKLRYLEGLTLKETADTLNVEISSLCKAQHNALKKMYYYEF